VVATFTLVYMGSFALGSAAWGGVASIRVYGWLPASREVPIFPYKLIREMKRTLRCTSKVFEQSFSITLSLVECSSVWQSRFFGYQQCLTHLLRRHLRDPLASCVIDSAFSLWRLLCHS
jgi:hypothetical protein